MDIFLIILWIAWVIGYPIYKKGIKKEEVFDGSYKYPCIMLFIRSLMDLF